MPIDSTVVNGIVVSGDQITDRVLEIQDGIFITEGQESQDEAWRTINASGYFVIPGLVQNSHNPDINELEFALQGVTTLVPSFRSSSIEDLSAELGTYKSRARINYLPGWKVPPETSAVMIEAAIEQGIRVFDVDNVTTENLRFSNGEVPCTVRLNGSSPMISELVRKQSNSHVVIHVRTSDELESVRSFSTSDTVFVEISLDVLLDDPEFSETDHIPDSIDIVTLSDHPANRPILPTLFHRYYQGQPDGLGKIVQLTSVNPARAYWLDHRKAGFSIGADADFFVVDLEKSDTWNDSEHLGRVIFSQSRGDILLYNEAIDIVPGQATVED